MGIKEGDIVSVNCNNAHITISHKAEVINRPNATGDCWEFKDVETGKYICSTEGITIIHKNEPANKKH